MLRIWHPLIMRTMQRSKEEIIKDEKLAGAVQVLPNDGLFAVEVSNFKYFDFQGGFERNRPKKEYKCIQVYSSVCKSVTSAV